MASSGEFMELVWENGQVLLRGRKTNTTPSCISSSRYSKPKANGTEGEIYPRKRPRLDTIKTMLDLCGQGFAKKYACSVQDDHYPEFSRFMETGRDSTHDKYITEPQIVPVCQEETPRLGDASEMEITQLAKARIDQVDHQSPLQQCQVSDVFRKSIMNQGSQSMAMGGLPDSTSRQMKSSGQDKNVEFRNFSLFLRPGIVSPKGSGQHGNAACSAGYPSSSRLQKYLDSNREKLPVAPHKPVTGTENAKESCQCLHLEAPGLDKNGRSSKDIIPDEESEAPVYKSNRIPDPKASMDVDKRKIPDAGKSIDQLASAPSICSRGASNDLTHSSSKRKNDCIKDIASPAEKADNEEQVPKLAPVSSVAKKKRSPVVHNLSERKRRDKINKKMRALQALIPNSDKVDKASMLDMAIEYLKTLQLQLQILSMGSSLCMPPMMMPTAMQQIQAQHLAHFSPVMGMRIMGSSPFINSALLGLAGAQMLPLPVTSQPKFIPLTGSSTTCTVPGAFPFSDLLFMSKDAILSNNSAMTNNVAGSEIQQSFQATRQSPNNQIRAKHDETHPVN